MACNMPVVVVRPGQYAGSIIAKEQENIQGMAVVVQVQNQIRETH
jgi:hypothetical protein